MGGGMSGNLQQEIITVLRVQKMSTADMLAVLQRRGQQTLEQRQLRNALDTLRNESAVRLDDGEWEAM